ncbi:hypothetical protein QOT17_025038 [Balamuthia mandrillaris]
MEENILSLLDENTLELVLCHLEPSGVARLMTTCSALHKACNSKSLWLVLYLRTFGADFWGENAGVHPYVHETLHELTYEYEEEAGVTKVTAVRDTAEALNNEWRRCPPGDVLQRFAETYPPSHWDPSVPFDLRRFFSEEEAKEANNDNALKKLFRTHLHMFRVWQQQLLKRAGEQEEEEEEEEDLEEGFPTTFVLAGMDPASLDLVLSLIEKYCQLFTPIHGLGQRLDSPGGCSIYSHAFNDSLTYRDSKAAYRVVKVPKPRGYLRRISSEQDTAKIVYVVDGDKLLAEKEHRSEVYREFHGILGEARYSDNIFVSLLVTSAKSEDRIVGQVMNALKISRHDIPDHMCPYYLGPVVVGGCRAVPTNTTLDIESLEQTIAALSKSELLGSAPTSAYSSPLDSLFQKQPAAACWFWLTRQPGRTPEWDFHPWLPARYHIGELKATWDESQGWPA